MHAQHRRFIDSRSAAAALWASGLGIVHANQRWRRWLQDAGCNRVLEAACAACGASGDVRTATIGSDRLLLVPLFVELGIAHHVLALHAAGVADVSRVLHELYETDRNARELARLNAMVRVGNALNGSIPDVREAIRQALVAASAALEAMWIVSAQRDPNVIAHPAEGRLFARALDELRDGARVGVTNARREWNGEAPRPALHVPFDDERPSGHGLTVVGAAGAAAFDECDVYFCRDLASRLGAALRRYAAREREAEMTRTIQAGMLPLTMPRSATVSFDSSYRPADGEALAGGDWYDAFELPDGRIAFSVGDVADRGLSSMVTMGRVRDMVRLGALEGEAPGDVLARVNSTMFARSYGVASALLGYVDPLTLQVTYASAGHAPPIFVHGSGSIQTLPTGGLIAGASASAEYQTATLRMSDGSALVFYTDGLIECGGNLLSGELRLARVLSAWAEASFKHSASALVDDVLQGREATDDIAMLVLRSTCAPRIEATLPAEPASSARARSAIGRVLGEARAGNRTGDFVLAMCEAVNNAIEHGTNSPDDRITFGAEWDARGFHGFVESPGGWRTHAPSDERGRGIVLMRALTDRLDIQSDRFGTRVRMSAQTIRDTA